MRLFEVERSLEDHRILRAYCDKNKISIQDLMRMSPEEIENIWNDALSNKDKYPVPKTETGYLYHGTSKKNLSGIKKNGLVPRDENKKTRWAKTSVGEFHSRNRLFFAKTIDKAEFYAQSRTKSKPLFIRVLSKDVPNQKDDPQEEQSVYVSATVPPEKLEYWDGLKWKPM